MLTIKGLYNRVKELNTEEVINKAFDTTLQSLEDINRERMLDGIRADGTEMPVYSKISQEVYGYPNTRIKLKATGSFQSKIEVKREGDVLITDSSDEKSEMLQNRYGEKIFGTGGSYKKQYLKESLRPALNKEIKAITGLKFGK